MSANDVAAGFFDRYATEVEERDARGVAELFAVPSLIVFPEQPLPVTDTGEIEAFFASTWSKQEGPSTGHDLTVVAETGHSIWADVRWHSEGGEDERYMYQLVRSEGAWKISVLTPLQ